MSTYRVGDRVRVAMRGHLQDGTVKEVLADGRVMTDRSFYPSLPITLTRIDEHGNPMPPRGEGE